MTFLDNPLNLPEVNHKDCNKLNNHLSNLEYCTRKHNREHAYIHGKKCEGEKNGMHKLTMMQVAKIIMSDKSNRQLAKEFGVSISTISKIRRGESWKCIYYIYIYWDD